MGKGTGLISELILAIVTLIIIPSFLTILGCPTKTLKLLT